MVSTARSAFAALALTLCSIPAQAQVTAAADRPQFIKVVARDYVFDAPTSVQSGIATIQLVNQGTDIHHVTVQELPEGHTVKEFFDATRAGRAPAWSRSLGQSSTIPNGGEAFISFRMPPGRYILSCLIPARDGRSHVAKGMYQLITAAGAPAVTTTRAPAAAPRKP